MANKYARTGGGNWNTNATWSTTDGGAADTTAPTASDVALLVASSGQVTVNATTCVAATLNMTNYANTLTFTAGQTLTLSGTATNTLAGTLAGTGTLAITGACTIAGTPTSSSGVLFTSSKNVTMGTGANCIWGNMTFSAGVLTLGASVYTVNLGTLATIWSTGGVQKLYVSGNVTGSAYSGASGTPEIVMTGTGSIPATFGMGINFTIDSPLGTITFGTGTISFSNPTGHTFTYVQGILANVENVILRLMGAGTLDVDGITWNTVNASVSMTLLSNFQCTTLNVIIAGAVSFLGADVTADTVIIQNRGSLTISAGQTLDTAHLYINGVEGLTTTLKSSSASSNATINISSGEDENMIFRGTVTDIAFNKPMYNWQGTTTRGSNCTTVQNSDITNTNLLLK